MSDLGPVRLGVGLVVGLVVYLGVRAGEVLRLG